MNRNMQSKLFAFLYALAAMNGREEALFGRSMAAAQEAFARSTACEDFPEVWFELPLAGEPWLDLHLLASSESLGPGQAFAQERTGGYPEIFEWFAAADGVRQLALSWDTGSGDGSPAAQVLVSGRDPEVPCAFLSSAGRADLQEAYRSFVGRIPEGWFACYTGVFPGRAHSFVRVECIPHRHVQEAYAADASLLEADLRRAGIGSLGATAVERCHELACSPFPLEFQFDVLPDGTLGPTFGASVRFAAPPGQEDWLAFNPQGAAGELMRRVEEWGLADERWHLLADTIFAKRLTREGASVTLFNYPAFIKLRWRDGEPLDAKAYLLAGVQDGTTPKAAAVTAAAAAKVATATAATKAATAAAAARAAKPQC